MKIRNGFVSNSSSSSFVIAFPKHVGCIANMGRFLFGTYRPNAKIDYNSDYSQKMVAETVYNDYCEAKRRQREDPVNFIESIRDEVSEEELNNLLKNSKDCIILSLSYADEDGSYMGAIEHGGIFDNVPHVRISHH